MHLNTYELCGRSATERKWWLCDVAMLLYKLDDITHSPYCHSSTAFSDLGHLRMVPVYGSALGVW